MAVLHALNIAFYINFMYYEYVEVYTVIFSGDASNAPVTAIVVPIILVTVLLAIILCILVVVLIILRQRRYRRNRKVSLGETGK